MARIGRPGEASSEAAAKEWRRKPEACKAWFWLASLASKPKATRNIKIKKMKFLLKHFSAQRDIQSHHKHKAQPKADCAVV